MLIMGGNGSCTLKEALAASTAQRRQGDVSNEPATRQSSVEFAPVVSSLNFGTKTNAMILLLSELYPQILRIDFRLKLDLSHQVCIKLSPRFNLQTSEET